MRVYWYCLLMTGLLLPASLFAQQNPVTIRGQLTDCERDSLLLFVADGTMIRPIQKFPLQKQGSNAAFQLTIDDIPQTTFFYVGGGQRNDTRLLLLGPDSEVTLQGACPDLGSTAQVHSPTTEIYERAKRRVDQQQKRFSALIAQYRASLNQPESLEKTVADMATLDAQKRALLDSLKEIDAFLGKVFALKTYISYQNNGRDVASEGHYFAQRYFQFADLSDPAYDRSPHVYEAFLAYAQTLPRVGLTAAQQIEYTEAVLSALSPGQVAHRMALLGLTHGFRGGNGQAFVQYGEQFSQRYAAQNPLAVQQLQALLQTEKSLMIGALAPEIVLPNPAGDSLRLSDLRGKIVLIDFWASWCGPCRRENPNVVRVYQQYKEQGFEILGVSLDRTQEAWVKAIEKDQLEWLHVSDLQYWQSIAAKTYAVSSIPATVLLDREGRIVAKGLRGPALEQKIAELLGNG